MGASFSFALCPIPDCDHWLPFVFNHSYIISIAMAHPALNHDATFVNVSGTGWSDRNQHDSWLQSTSSGTDSNNTSPDDRREATTPYTSQSTPSNGYTTTLKALKAGILEPRSSRRKYVTQKLQKHRIVCHECHTKSTPQWRSGPEGPGTLCNVCGLLFAKRVGLP